MIHPENSLAGLPGTKTAGLETPLSQQQLEHVLSSITDGLALLDRDWRYTYFSAQAARIIGVSAAEVLGQCVWDFFPEARGTKFDEGFHRAVATGRTVDFEEYYPAPIGKWLECHCHPSGDGLAVYFHDITPRKRAEETLRQNEALFSTLIEQAPLGVYVVNADFRVHQVNPRALPAFGSIDPLLGRDFAEVMEFLWGPEVGGECTRIFRHTLETGESYFSPPFKNQRFDVEFEQAVDWETRRVTMPDGRHGVVCYFSDVTARRRAEAALQEARDAAEAASRSKDRFLAVLSHELRTPLTPVLMTVEALEQDAGLPPEIREDVAMIRRNIELETRIIDDLLDLSSIASGKLELKFQPVDVNESVRDVCRICRPEILKQDARLELDLSPALGLIAADPARLHQILWNVLRNAVKFSRRGGAVRVTTCQPHPGRCQVRVSDEGIGIPAEMLGSIFNEFEHGDLSIMRQFGGLGLGLTICKALVDLHGGFIEARSAGSGQGATFVIDLPAGPAAAGSAAPSKDADRGETEPPSVRVLLVEDHADTARTLARMLGRAGFAVVTVPDVARALALIRDERFDILVSDLGLPDGTGHEIMRAARARHGMPGISISGYGMEDDVRQSAEAGFSEHLVKPVPVSRLIDAINRRTRVPTLE
ncbi:MAG: Histidine kinase [Verrucomicrobiales bacterium]|nr:Histidine kinase [Verrucomicrobiales bacterium]